MRTGGRVAVGGVLGVLVAAALVATLNPVPLPLVVDATLDTGSRVLSAAGMPSDRAWHLTEALANVALLVPVGLLAGLLVRPARWWLVLGGALLGSLAVEAVQDASLPHRLGSLRDVLANTLGAALGLALAAFATWVRRRAVASRTRASGLDR